MLAHWYAFHHKVHALKCVIGWRSRALTFEDQIAATETHFMFYDKGKLRVIESDIDLSQI